MWKQLVRTAMVHRLRVLNVQMDRQACHAQEKVMGDGAISECKYWVGRQTGDKCVHEKLTVDTAALQDLYINAVDHAKSLLLQCLRPSSPARARERQQGPKATRQNSIRSREHGIHQITSNRGAWLESQPPLRSSSRVRKSERREERWNLLTT